MKYVTTERFIVSSNTSEAQVKYRDNYDAVFRQDAPEEPVHRAAPYEHDLTVEPVNETIDVGSDGIECRVRGYVYECQTCKCLHTDPAGHQHHATFTPALEEWGDRAPQYNGCGEPCDMWTGPCLCGATHVEGR